MFKMANCEIVNQDGSRQHEKKPHYESLEPPNVAPLSNESDTRAKMEALDLRVTGSLKSKNLSAARRDAIAMIRANKSDGRGYVRCGQIELLAGDIPAASQWYEHGLRRVPESDRLYTYMKEQLRRITVSSRPRDPVSLLPAEIMELVVSYLEYRQIARAHSVSRLWAGVLPTIRPMSDTVDFRISTKSITATSAKTALRRVKKSARTFYLTNLSEAARRSVKSHLDEYKDYPKLQTLSLSSMDYSLWSLPFSKYPLTEINISDSIGGVEMATIVRILKTCKALKVGRFSNILVPGAYYPDAVSVQDFRTGLPISNVLTVLHFNCQEGPSGFIDLQASKRTMQTLVTYLFFLRPSFHAFRRFKMLSAPTQNFQEQRSPVIFRASDICGNFACIMSVAYCRSFQYLLKPGEAQAAPTPGQMLFVVSNIIT